MVFFLKDDKSFLFEFPHSDSPVRGEDIQLCVASQGTINRDRHRVQILFP